MELGDRKSFGFQKFQINEMSDNISFYYFKVYLESVLSWFVNDLLGQANEFILGNIIPQEEKAWALNSLSTYRSPNLLSLYII